ncbi:alkaline phosphatase D family protein [Flavobacterium sp. RSP15]|uniref:alkaline phosphatase D family protein n=1 Tax=Flavobacterium sp. RSP15 TaxID=2497485 RepID=UPI000F84BA14|nr:alkaline phosphatase D family protein [Flavobacterium sp. RSP15]RTY85913.1 alkaline phosphatase family protein [Flavobacterium sp. RSP15]
MIQNNLFKIPLFLAALTLLSSNGYSQKNLSKIAFGSCSNQSNSLSIFDVVVKHQPDLFIFLGDNIYGDTENMHTLQAKYEQLAAKPTFQNLKKNMPIIATWDDHDYGQNDAGRHYPKKKESKELFLNFFEEPIASERRKHEGIYTSYLYETKGKKVQIILLDNRTFRDDYKLYNNEFKDDKRYFYSLDYAPVQNPDSTYLGAEQWKWLETELQKPADLRLIGSGSQFGIEYNGYEGWANFPLEQQRLLDLIKKTKANGILFLTGDVHYGEISKLTEPELYPIYDFTSSGLSSTWHFATPNKNRIEGPIMDNHFGLLTISWKKKIPEIKMEIWDVNNNQRAEYTIGLDEISFRK